VVKRFVDFEFTTNPIKTSNYTVISSDESQIRLQRGFTVKHAVEHIERLLLFSVRKAHLPIIVDAVVKRLSRKQKLDVVPIFIIPLVNEFPVLLTRS